MKNSIVRVLSVELNNFRNVVHGIVTFNEYSDILKGQFNRNKPSILGIYGQNGSGKTSVIFIMQLLKDLILEEKFDNQLYENISTWSNSSMVKFTFLLTHYKEKYLIDYEIILTKNQDAKTANIGNESFSVKSFDPINNKWGKAILNYDIDFKNDEITDIFNFNRYSKVVDSKAFIKVNVIKGICQKNNTSLIFNEEILGIIDEIKDKNDDLKVLRNLLVAFKYFATYNLFVINNKDSSLISSIDLMPLNLRIIDNKNDKYKIFSGTIPVKLFESQLISLDEYKIIKEIISEINIIMPTLIPNFSIQIVDLGNELMKDGKKGKKIEFVSVVKGFKIPLKNESEGTKKIISICSALISAFNSETVCLCIDEFDSGVFEFLLGQLLKILSLGAKGQVLFTSHNLRPLEVLSKENILVTTTNLNNRYIKLKHIKTTNNVRDFYLRGLLIGGQDEEIYNETDINDIARAFRRAGEINNGKTN